VQHNPQWLWISAQLSTNWDSTESITARKWHLLQLAITGHTTKGNLIFQPVHHALFFKLSELLEISQAQMNVWKETKIWCNR
jgi:hypothetical protein